MAATSASEMSSTWERPAVRPWTTRGRGVETDDAQACPTGLPHQRQADVTETDDSEVIHPQDSRGGCWAGSAKREGLR